MATERQVQEVAAEAWQTTFAELDDYECFSFADVSEPEDELGWQKISRKAAQRVLARRLENFSCDIDPNAKVYGANPERASSPMNQTEFTGNPADNLAVAQYVKKKCWRKTARA